MSSKPIVALAAAGIVSGCTINMVDQGYEADRPVFFQASDFAAACGQWDDWDKPAPPFRIFGNSYHVGTCGISAILITGPEGHVLLDGGTEKGGALIADNVRKLGFSLRHVRTISHTQEHFDHVGGIASLKAATGAQLLASEEAAGVFASGETHEDDPQFGLHDPFPAATVEQVIEDGHAIMLGERELVATATPGHSPGALSWQWVECEGEECRVLLFTDGMTPVSSDDYRFSDHGEALDAYRASIDWLASAEADICLTAHPSGARLIERIENGAMIDPGACAAYAASVAERLDERLAAEGAR